jgi:lipopolysaccharide heptosyltransferase II
MPKFLFIQLKRAGDVLLTIPVVAAVHRRWPDAEIDFLVDRPFASLLENNPSIRRVWIYDRQRRIPYFPEMRQRKYDQIFDFQSSPRSALFCLLSAARSTAGYRVPFWGRVYDRAVKRPDDRVSVVEGKLSLISAVLGDLAEAPPPHLFLTPEEQRWAQQFDNAGQARGIVGLVPTHRRESRRWSASAFASVAKSYSARGYAVWLFWGPGERDYVLDLQRNAPEARLIPETTFRQMAALFARCDAVISNDNGPMHLAVAVGRPTVTIYGPTDPKAWNPGGSDHLALRHEGLSCLGCNLNQCPFNHECMNELSPKVVFEASLALVESAKTLPKNER